MSFSPYLQVALSSARFAKRRSSLEGQKPQIETLIVDVDRTITAEDSPKLALKKLIGEEHARRIFDSFLSRVLRGKLKIQDLHSEIFGELYSRGFRRSDWVSVMEDLERSGGIKRHVVDTLMELSERERLTVALATRASREGAQWLARRFGFHHAVGSVERVNGVFQGFDVKIGAADDGNGTLTKLTAVSREMEMHGKALDPARTAVIANDLLDALEMLRCARGIVLLPNAPNRLERLTVRLRLYDVLVKEADAQDGIGKALGFAS